MFAVFEDGSHQFRVQPGDLLWVDFRDGAEKGSTLTFDKVLAAGTDSASQIGRPVLTGATVTAEVVDADVHAPKIEGGKFRRRKNYIRHWGHKQPYTAIKITAINVPGLA